MSRIGRIAKNILVWSYERGTIQYDIICALILAFIFFVPRSCFVPNQNKVENPHPYQKHIVSEQQPAKAKAVR
jgi:hypothetical protein